MWKAHELHLVTGDHIIGNLMFHHNIKMSAKHKKLLNTCASAEKYLQII